MLELLVVIAIIGILSTITFAAVNSVRAKARDAKRKADLRQIALALELYYNDYDRYPGASSGNEDDGAYNNGWRTFIQDGCSTEVFDALSPYMPTIPEDSLTPTYRYFYEGDGHGYWLGSHLESTGDSNYTTVEFVHCGMGWPNVFIHYLVERRSPYAP